MRLVLAAAILLNCAFAQDPGTPLGPPPEPLKLRRAVTLAVRIEGGGQPTEAAYVEISCPGGTEFSGFTDKHGVLVFERDLPAIALPGAGSGTAPKVEREMSMLPNDCTAHVNLPGYRSVPGTPFLLRPLGAGEGWSVSITTYKAPEKARRAYFAGLEATHRSRWNDAENRFQQALKIYDQYASAWFQIGVIRQKTGRIAEAREAYDHAVKLDPKFTLPYVQLVELAAAEGNWAEADRLLGIVIPLKPFDAPAAYYYQAASLLRFNRIEEAETSARLAVKSDVSGREPNFRRLLGVILARRGQREEAITYLREYLARSPKAADADQISSYVRKLEGQ